MDDLQSLGSVISEAIRGCTNRKGCGGAYVAADAAADGLCAGTSCHIDCRSIGFEPPSCRNHCRGTSGGKGDRERCIWGSRWDTSHVLPEF